MAAAAAPTPKPICRADTQGAPLEHVFFATCLALCWGLLWPSSDPNARLFCIVVAVVLLVFVILPWIEPRLAPSLMGADVTRPCYSRYTQTVVSLYEVRDYMGMIKFFLLSAFSGANHLLMPIEYSVLPGLRKARFDNLTFILGHQRSGTTHLHKAVNHSLQADHSSMFDVVCPSVTVKFLFLPVRWVVGLLISTYSSDEHKVGLNEEGEEHVWLLHCWKTAALFMLFPSLQGHPDADELFRACVAYDEEDVRFVRRCMQGVLYSHSFWRGQTQIEGETSYVGRPLGLTANRSLLKRVFPNCRVVVVVREPRAAMSSWCQLFATTSGRDLSDRRFQRFSRTLYNRYSREVFLAAIDAAASEDADTFAVLFDDWKTDSTATLTAVLDHLRSSVGGLQPGSQACSVPPRSEHHRRDPRSTQLAQIDGHLQEKYSEYISGSRVLPKS